MAMSLHKSKISRIVSRQVVTVPPETLAATAIGVMAQARISCLVIAEKKMPLGIFTERDLVKVAGRSATLGELPISALMTHPVVTISGELTILEAYGLMLTNKIRHHVVVNKRGAMLGVMSQSDLINRLGFEYFVEMRKVEQVMSRTVMTVPRELPVGQTLARMAASGISCAVVTEKDLPVGIVTERDAVRLVAEGHDLERLPTGAVMSQPVVTVPVGTTVHKAAQIMKQAHIRRVVVESNGQVEGIVTQSDIVKGLEGQYIESLREIIREKEDIFQQTARELLDKTIYLDNILNSSIDMGIVATDRDFIIKYFNPVAEKVFGYSAADAIGHSVMELHAAEGIAPARLFKARDIVRKKGFHAFPVAIATSGATRWFDGRLSSIVDKQNRLVGYVLMLHDITKRRQNEEAIRFLAYHDALTGLPNRILLNDRLTQALAASHRNSSQGALMILDLDRFKDVNDTLGHGVGDELLRAVSRRLQELLRKSDTVSRMGGDEFVLLLPTVTSREAAMALGEKIVKAFRKPFLCSDQPLQVTASIGLVLFPTDGDDGETLLKRADIALYRVKEGGRNGVLRYTVEGGA
ncbi:MAG: hypothetical protein A2005_01010 [Desulfuromonadales bacterium GWC2_61_20]|nr:MAG: hypothetical protein A2005_01010 [Desulfuromonadales bacterium GWC2_61_20]